MEHVEEILVWKEREVVVEIVQEKKSLQTNRKDCATENGFVDKYEICYEFSWTQKFYALSPLYL